MYDAFRNMVGSPKSLGVSTAFTTHPWSDLRLDPVLFHALHVLIHTHLAFGIPRFGAQNPGGSRS